MTIAKNVDDNSNAEFYVFCHLLQELCNALWHRYGNILFYNVAMVIEPVSHIPFNSLQNDYFDWLPWTMLATSFKIKTPDMLHMLEGMKNSE